MQIQLNKIKLENFKGQKFFEFSPDGQDASIQAENGVGKTTVYDAWLWLLFGKDSDGKTEFSVRPLDENNEPIKGLVVAVEANININDENHTLRKEQHEKIVKGQLKGYETVCFIDEVPKKVGEFQEYIINLCPEDIFKMLTDLDYFNGKMNRTARRKVLLDVIGKILTPAGFEDLLKNLNGRSLEDYEKVLSDRKKGYKKERDEINTRIDETQRRIDDYVQNADENKLENQRQDVQKTIDELTAQRAELLKSEKKRQEINDRINQLTVERLHRESQLKSDTSGHRKLLDEKMNLEADIARRKYELNEINTKIEELESTIRSIDNQIAQQQNILESIREEYKQVDIPNCPTCGQKWPEGKPKPAQADIAKRGREEMAILKQHKKNKAEKEELLIKLYDEQEKKNCEIKSTEADANKRIKEIEQALKKKIEIDPTTDEKYQQLTAEIEKLQKDQGAPVVEQLDIIENNIKAAQEKLNKINESLAQADNYRKARKRINELEAREKELAQLTADTEKEFDRIQQFKMAESKMIEVAVNDRFKHVEFKLFEYYLNGEIKDTCEALLNGVPYPDMSSGQKILTGIDIVNTLSEHYGVSIPLFIDHAESITYPIETEMQTIQLKAVKGLKSLQVQTEMSEVAA